MAKCISERTKVNKLTGEYITFPCGKCYVCHNRRINGWGFRLDTEMKYSKSALFLTLTYDEAHVPITEHGLYTLHKPHIQGFFKRLRQHEKRKNFSGDKVSYYAIGEYGSLLDRPHYHIILYNSSLEMATKAWVDNNKQPFGHIHDGKVESASIRYVAGYFAKSKQVPLHHLDDRKKEFSLMSKGLGKAFLTDNIFNWFYDDPFNRFYIPLKDGKKLHIPRYFKSKLYTKEQLEEINQVVMENIYEEQLEHVRKFGAQRESAVIQYHELQTKKLRKKRHETF